MRHTRLSERRRLPTVAAATPTSREYTRIGSGADRLAERGFAGRLIGSIRSQSLGLLLR